MKEKAFLLVFLIVLGLTSFVSVVSAADEEMPGGESVINIGVGGTNVEATGVNCFDYYHFGSVVFTYPHAEKVSYAPGETASIITTIMNENDYAIVQGNVIAHVYYSNTASGNEQGDYLLDEFTAFDGLALGPGQSYELAVEWKIPENAPKGEYYVALFFQELHSFNLAGLPFLPNVYGGYAAFNVESTATKQQFYLDRNAVLLNNEPQLLRHFSKNFEQGQTISYEVPIVNTTAQQQNVSLKYELYAWDQSTETNLLSQYTKSETISVPANSSKKASISFSNLEPGAYELKIKASTESWQNILLLRFTVKGAKGRFVHIGLTAFPIVKGDSFAMFACFSNTTDWFSDFSGKVTLELKDSKGNVLATESYEGKITPKIMAIKKDIVADASYDELYLTAKISDSKGALHQEITKAYRLSDFRDKDFINSYNERKGQAGKPTPTSTPTQTPAKTPTPRQTVTPAPTTPAPTPSTQPAFPFEFVAIGIVVVLAIVALFYLMKKKEKGQESGE